ncbi:hypothetical protein [Zavarzinia aquatilis]|uniref:Uncharacterized protein n=1 Tax=Zavarzinia aquatilis TaxID=2211142 RepID=A0A317EBV7_9PROT|nr:hypothetical protein [Zavarzinia aquatilis]PWR24547.1 hypothetical protein DKG74_07005 [Zavarzinia aquatilis]
MAGPSASTDANAVRETVDAPRRTPAERFAAFAAREPEAAEELMANLEHRIRAGIFADGRVPIPALKSWRRITPYVLGGEIAGEDQP